MPELPAGEARIAAASSAAERAVAAAEQVKQRLRAAQEAEYGEDGTHMTPSKPRKARYTFRPLARGDAPATDSSACTSGDIICASTL